MSDINRINPRTGKGDGVIIQVSGVDLHFEFLLSPVHQLAQQDGDGVSLLAAGAASHPDAKRVIIRFVFAQ